MKAHAARRTLPTVPNAKLRTWAPHRPVLGGPLRPGAACATAPTTAATEPGDNQDRSYLKSFNKEDISYLDEQQVCGHS